MKISRHGKLVKTNIKFRPYGTSVQLPIRGRAKVYFRAQAGAAISTYVYVNDDDSESSLLGKNDAERLGIIQINLRGSREEIKLEPEKEITPEEEVQRIKLCRRAGLKKGSGETAKEDDKKMNKLVKDYAGIFQGIGEYRGEPVRIKVDKDASPIIQPPRRIPLHYVEPLKEHLEE